MSEYYIYKFRFGKPHSLCKSGLSKEEAMAFCKSEPIRYDKETGEPVWFYGFSETKLKNFNVGQEEL